MPNNEYTAEQALELLMKKLKDRDPELAAEVQLAIDAGKDISETQRLPGRRKEHIYRRTIPLSHQEALQVAIAALRAYFVEEPMFVNSAGDNFVASPISIPTNQPMLHRAAHPEILEAEGQEKTIEIEIQTETQVLRTGDETQRITRVPTQQIEEQRQNLKQLSDLTDFD